MEEFSLYLELKKGEKPDLQTTAQSLIAFADLVKEIAFFIDPFENYQLEFVSATPGSLSFNSILKSLKEDKKKVFKAVFLASSFWLGGKALDFAWDKISDHIWDHVAGEKEFSPEQKREIEEIIQRVMKGRVGEKQSQRFFRYVSHDPSVKGAGLSSRPNKKPKYITYRNDFAKHAGLASEKQGVARRTRTEIVKTVLISPMLVDGKRRWKFRSVEGEFGAPVLDEHFVESMLAGQLPIIMRRNVELEIELETIDEYRDGVWVPVERNVLRIVGTPRQFQGDQDSLGFDK